MALLCCPALVQAQSVSRPVVQPLPPAASGELSDALKALARNSEDVDALIAAGEAAIKLDDIDAALGFLGRAQAISSDNPRINAGLAGIALRQDNPVRALQLYDEAEKAGLTMAPYAADRALAYDLVGNNARAQQLYKVALASGEDPQLRRQLAMSQAISGDKPAFEATLLPLLQQQDLSAFRTRAFGLAVLGETEEAVSIAEAMLPEKFSDRIAPYLRYMPRLTRAQQAAAANLGKFPDATKIGRDDPAMLAFGDTEKAAADDAASASSVNMEERLVPKGRQLGQKTSGEQAAARRGAAKIAPGRTAMAEDSELPAISPAQPSPAAPERPKERPGAALVKADTGASAEAAPAEPVRPVPEEQVKMQSLADAFSDFTLSPRDSAPVVPSGAVDLSKFEAPREKPAPPPKPKPPAHPSRNWVQVATGKNVSAFRFDWKRISRKADGLLDGKTPYTVPWVEANRLLFGPFPDLSDAQSMVKSLKEKGVDSFTFTSEEGEKITPLD
ncbi:tetratricopeptide repeat protein [Altericroceibacterium spongiae]|uniref:Tetratricopeptide repeat protein n=2 Tax=Altericroceibacterium spongiae TaxID=2320269 RepID=A0A420EKK2_9SPHN|nr:tetratricopeptide repeat protein [Altericroceibacterium spongiae]